MSTTSTEPVRCPACVAAGTRSRVYVDGRRKTLMHDPPFYDEEGFYHEHDGNKETEYLRCVNGHTWARVIQHSCWCGWKQGETPNVFNPDGGEMRCRVAPSPDPNEDQRRRLIGLLSRVLHEVRSRLPESLVKEIDRQLVCEEGYFNCNAMGPHTHE